MSAADIADQGWNLLAGDLPLPVMALREDAMRVNVDAMTRFCEQHGVELAPHGKTTGSPELWRWQMDSGAWAITAATIFQAQAMFTAGVTRVLIANEVVDAGALRWIAQTLDAHPGFELSCLVDSTLGVEIMETVLAAAGASRRLDVLVELGLRGGRAGCRSRDQAIAVARAAAAAPHLRLVGVEGYEGIVDTDTPDFGVAAVDAMLGDLAALVGDIDRLGVLDGIETMLVTAGGSVFFDRVTDVLGSLTGLSRPSRLVLRSGCYITHDHGHYHHVSPFDGRRREGPALVRPAIEVWGDVLSRPEPDLAIAGFGRRDVPYDLELPVVTGIRPRGEAVREVSGGLVVTALNDQHAYIKLEGASLNVGDQVIVGISHPCTAFDKWRLIPVVNENRDVVGAVQTIF